LSWIFCFTFSMVSLMWGKKKREGEHRRRRGNDRGKEKREATRENREGG
jgi:hypothetical protein